MSALQRVPDFVPPKPPECVCGAFRPAVVVPVGDGAVEMCWICAHLVTEHEIGHTRRALGAALDKGVCRCTRDQIYPSDDPPDEQGGKLAKTG